jgi:hypothetical protein
MPKRLKEGHGNDRRRTDGHPVELPAAEPAKLPAIDTPAGHAPAGHTPETDPQTDAEPAAPGDAQELEQEIERSREQLGATAEELAARTEAKARARDKAAELSGRVKSKTGQARKEAAARAASARSQLAGKAAAAREKAMGGRRRWERPAAEPGSRKWAPPFGKPRRNRCGGPSRRRPAAPGSAARRQRWLPGRSFSAIWLSGGGGSGDQAVVQTRGPPDQLALRRARRCHRQQSVDERRTGRRCSEGNRRAAALEVLPDAHTRGRDRLRRLRRLFKRLRRWEHGSVH